jgi:hypothetical protein
MLAAAQRSESQRASDLKVTKQTSNKVRSAVRFNVRCDARSDKLTCANEAPGHGSEHHDRALTITTKGIVMATRSLSPKRALEKMRQYRAAVMTIAHYRAKQAVKAEIRARGQKIAEFSARDIALLAEAYMAQHRDWLITKAAEDVATFREFARYRAEIDVASVCIPPGNRTLPSDSGDNPRTNQQ